MAKSVGQLSKPFQAVKSVKITEVIAEEIKKSLLKGDYWPGERLPSERELCEQFQVSRLSIREALKSLQAEGLIVIKRGSGAFVVKENSKPVGATLSTILKIKKADRDDLIETRLAIEPSIAKLACEKITEEDISRLEQNIKEASDLIKSDLPAPELHLEFHYIIAEACHNPAIGLILKMLHNVLKEFSTKLSEEQSKDLDFSKAVLNNHKKMLDAFKKRDPEKTYNLMKDDIINYSGIKAS